MFGSTEIIIIVLIVFLLFGAKSLPKFAKSIGEARKELQKSMDDAKSENNQTTNESSSTKTNEQKNTSTKNEASDKDSL